MIRFIIICIFLVSYLLLSIPVFVIEWILGKFSPRARDISSLRLIQWPFKVILWITGIKTTVIGEESIPDEPVLFVGNHRSFFDILITYSRCKDLTGYIAKKEMIKAPLLNIWMHFVYCLFLDRTDIKAGLKTILTAISYIKRGISICIFPEGTRNSGEELSLLPFRDGAFKIAEKTGCPIVVMSINNSADIFENHFPKIKPVHVILEYRVVRLNELSKEDRKHISNYCQNIITETIHRNASLIQH